MSNAELKALNALVGEWTTRATHPSFPNAVNGRATFEWLEGEQFLIQRSHTEHPDVPDGMGIIGVPDDSDDLSLFYFDSRGVHRVYAVSMRANRLRMWRDEPGFAQRFAGELSDDGTTLDGQWQLCRDGSTWDDDLKIVFRRAP